jgi:hypothetical protein
MSAHKRAWRAAGGFLVSGALHGVHHAMNAIVNVCVGVARASDLLAGEYYVPAQREATQLVSERGGMTVPAPTSGAPN